MIKFKYDLEVCFSFAPQNDAGDTADSLSPSLPPSIIASPEELLQLVKEAAVTRDILRIKVSSCDIFLYYIYIFCKYYEFFF